MKKLLQICTTIFLFTASAKAQPNWIAVNKEKTFVQENGISVYTAKYVTLTKVDYIVKNHYQKIYGLPVKTGDHVHVQINSNMETKTRLMVFAEIPGKRDWKDFKDTLTGNYPTPYVFDTVFASPGQFYLYVSTVWPAQEAKYYIRIIYSPKENNEFKDSSFCGRLQMLVSRLPYSFTGIIDGVKEEKREGDKSNRSYLLSPGWDLPGSKIYKNVYGEMLRLSDDYKEIRIYESIYAEATNIKIANAKLEELRKKIEECLPSWKRVKDVSHDFESIDKKGSITISVQEVKTGNNSKYIVLFSCTE
ncbi:MAG: hypothetical protein ACRDEB_01840 [Chitinophagaceae bacterium]